MPPAIAAGVLRIVARAMVADAREHGSQPSAAGRRLLAALYEAAERHESAGDEEPPPQAPSEASVTVAEAARRLGCSTRWVRHLLKTGGLQGRKDGGTWLVVLTSESGSVAAPGRMIEDMRHTETAGRWSFRLDRHDRFSVFDASMAVHDLLDQYRTASAEARTAVMTDDTLVGEAKTRAISEAVEALRAQYGAKVAAIETDARQEVGQLRAAFERQLPKPQTGVEALLGRQAWFSRAQALLKSEFKIRDVINTATDPEMLHALVDELPTMIATKQVTIAGDLPAGLRLINARLARLVGPAAVDAMEAAEKAQTHLGVLEPILRQASNVIGATDHRVTSQEDFTDALAQLGLRPRSL